MGLSLIKHIHMHQKKHWQLNQIALHTHLRDTEIVAIEKSVKRLIITKRSHHFWREYVRKLLYHSPDHLEGWEELFGLELLMRLKAVEINVK